MAHPLPSIGRAVLLGLVLGLSAAAFIFAFTAWNQLHVVCDFPETEECTQQLTTASEVARLESYASLGAALVAAGAGLLLLRGRRDG